MVLKEMSVRDYVACFSALQRAEIAEICVRRTQPTQYPAVSVLFNEPKLLKSVFDVLRTPSTVRVSVLFNEPKLLKCRRADAVWREDKRFSALQRAEIAEI